MKVLFIHDEIFCRRSKIEYFMKDNTNGQQKLEVMVLLKFFVDFFEI